MGIVTLLTECKNTILESECRRLGGAHAPHLNTWYFDDKHIDRVQELDRKYNSLPIQVCITFTQTIECSGDAVEVAGFRLLDFTGPHLIGDSFVLNIPEECYDDLKTVPYITVKV